MCIRRVSAGGVEAAYHPSVQAQKGKGVSVQVAWRRQWAGGGTECGAGGTCRFYPCPLMGRAAGREEVLDIHIHVPAGVNPDHGSLTTALLETSFSLESVLEPWPLLGY